ncbi:putative cysteine synthase B, partial [Aspergillus thermomutatus]
MAANELNVYLGPDALRKYFDPDCQPPLPLVEVPEYLNPYHQDGVRIYAKMMSMHPANNVKAMPALNMLQKKVVPGKTKTIIEYSSGSTVISMSMIARVMHGIHDTRAFLSNKTSDAKLKLMQFFGLDITLFGGPSQPEPFDDRGGIQSARKMGVQSDEVLNPNQYENPDNWGSHVRWTGPQILRQLPEINVLCAGMGTSGTMTGLGTFFKENKPSVLRLGVCTAPGDRVPGPRSLALLKPVEFPWKEAVDAIEEVNSYDSFSLSLELCREGIVCGPSSGFNLQGLFQLLEKRKQAGTLAELAGPDGLVHCVFICCDLPYQYIGEYFTKLGAEKFHPIRNENLSRVDVYRYDESWERSPIVLFTHFYETPRSLPDSLLRTLVLRPPCCVLDLRTAADYSTWHLPGSVNIPLRSLDSHTPKPFADPRVLEAQWLELETLFKAKEALSKLRGHHVLVICYHGDTARVATSVLRAKGIEADSLRGGYQALRDHGLWGENEVSTTKSPISVESVPLQAHLMMDMSADAGSGLPWLDQPVMLHSSRKDTCKLSPEQCAYRHGHWRYWYQADHVYALNTVYFMCATIGVFAITHFLSRRAPLPVKRSAIWRKATAAMRYLSYQGYQIPSLRYWSPSLGVMLLGLVGFVFFFAMTLGPKPYYWPNTATVSYGSSPPIATRTGWMALALLPFVLVLGTKANLISMLTGVPHEKLQVFHHWASYAMFVLALIHTFPFIIVHIDKGDMVYQWKTSLTYWTGVAALIPQAYLTIMSLPIIRNRYYEFFKATHVLVALLFVLFFFFHCDFRLTSWDYFIAAGALYFFSLCAAYIRTTLLHGLHKATLDVLPCGLVRIKIPTFITWAPGQHLFLLFLNPSQLGLHSLTAHPFTITSIAHDAASLAKPNELVFYIKPRGGITARLASLAARSPGTERTVLLEGPYGGVSASSDLARFDSVLVISGGSGGGFSLGIVDEVLKASTPALQIIFATRDQTMADWYAEEIETRIATSNVSGRDVSASVYVTSNTASKQQEQEQEQQLADGNESKLPSTEPTVTSTHVATTHGARPNLPDLIAAGTSACNKRVGIFVCGPASMLHDVRNAAAQAQRTVLGNGAEEVYLHLEPFS